MVLKGITRVNQKTLLLLSFHLLLMPAYSAAKSRSDAPDSALIVRRSEKAFHAWEVVSYS